MGVRDGMCSGEVSAHGKLRDACWSVTSSSITLTLTLAPLERQWKILFSSPCVVAHEDPGRKSAEDSGGLSINKHDKSQL